MPIFSVCRFPIFEMKKMLVETYYRNTSPIEALLLNVHSPWNGYAPYTIRVRKKEDSLVA